MRPQNAKRGERGQVLILFVIIFTVFLVMMTVALDVGNFESDRRTSQKDVDAAVLSGGIPLLTERDSATMEADAVARTIEWALRNGVDDPALVINPRIVQQCWDEPAFDGLPDGVEAEVDADSDLLIGHVIEEIFGGDLSIEVGAHARACVGSLITTTGLRPWAMPLFGEEDPADTCSAGSRLVDGDCVSNCFEKQDVDGDGDLEVVPSFGAVCRIRSDEPQSVGSINLEPDDQFSDCDSGSSSASTYKENIVEGSPANCSIGDIVGTKQGLATGPTSSGLLDLIATERACDELFSSPPAGLTDLGNGPTVWVDDFWEVFSPADAVPGPDTVYTARECDNDSTDLLGEPDSPRFITIAVVNQLPLDSGTQPVEIINFAGFYIEKCERLDNDGNYVPSPALDEAKCDLSGPASRFQIVGRFIQFQQLGGVGGPLTPFGTNVLLLVE